MALNENIKSRRIQLKMSQEYVADQLGISRQAVAKWESGQSRPTSSNLTELAALFEMDVSELVDPQKWVEDKRSEEHTSELQSRFDLVCRLLLEKKKQKRKRSLSNST